MPIAEDNTLKIIKLSLGPFGTNTYIVICKETHESVVIDTPGDAEKVVQALEGSVPKYILMTHSHMDHTLELETLKTELKVPVAAHPADAPDLPIVPDLVLNDGDVVTVGNVALRVIHVPGHTPGSVCFSFDSYLISGDTLFPGGPGKTWSPEGFKQIIASLTQKIFTLPEKTRVFPGHGNPAVVKKELENYKAFAAKGVDDDLYGDVSW